MFVSRRSRQRPGFVYRSREPYDHTAFEQVIEVEFTYPQPWWLGEAGCLHLFTQYTRVRELYCSHSSTGRDWTPPRKLAGMVGHYQISRSIGDRVLTAFNAHPDGNVDLRTNLYYLETRNLGESWHTITGHEITPPLSDFSHPVRTDALAPGEWLIGETVPGPWRTLHLPGTTRTWEASLSKRDNPGA